MKNDSCFFFFYNLRDLILCVGHQRTSPNGKIPRWWGRIKYLKFFSQSFFLWKDTVHKCQQIHLQSQKNTIREEMSSRLRAQHTPTDWLPRVCFGRATGNPFHQNLGSFEGGPPNQTHQCICRVPRGDHNTDNGTAMDDVWTGHSGTETCVWPRKEVGSYRLRRIDGPNLGVLYCQKRLQFF